MKLTVNESPVIKQLLKSKQHIAEWWILKEEIKEKIFFCPEIKWKWKETNTAKPLGSSKRSSMEAIESFELTH